MEKPVYTNVLQNCTSEKEEEEEDRNGWVRARVRVRACVRTRASTHVHAFKLIHMSTKTTFYSFA